MDINKITERLSLIPDPEVPVLTIKELGVLRKVSIKRNKITITITPTYSGCPAMDRFQDDIKKVMHELEVNNFEIVTQYDPAWTTDWLNTAAKEKLRKYGIAPPEFKTTDKNAVLGAPKTVSCPRCQSISTNLVSPFGSTACKAMYTCKDCFEPFEYFKCL
jgi:ring-1,2-phenylacetyl-CoA epoxidase subunit PaaD